jgi:hypothetical protein
MPISGTQRQILVAAAQHEARLTTLPASLPAAARNAVIRSILRNGLLAEVAAPDGHTDLAWRQDAGALIVLQITDAGVAAVINEADASGATEPGATQRPWKAPTPPRRRPLTPVGQRGLCSARRRPGRLHRPLRGTCAPEPPRRR